MSSFDLPLAEVAARGMLRSCPQAAIGVSTFLGIRSIHALLGSGSTRWLPSSDCLQLRALPPTTPRASAMRRKVDAIYPPFLSALRYGDTQGAARILGSPAVRYYTANVDAYAQGMQSHRDIIDERLGPPP